MPVYFWKSDSYSYWRPSKVVSLIISFHYTKHKTHIAKAQTIQKQADIECACVDFKFANGNNSDPIFLQRASESLFTEHYMHRDSGQCQAYLDPRIAHVHASSPAAESPVSWFSVERPAEESRRPMTNTRNELFCRSCDFPCVRRIWLWIFAECREDRYTHSATRTDRTFTHHGGGVGWR